MKFSRSLLTILVAGLVACAPAVDDAPETYDVLIVNGTVYDGSLAPPRQSNIGIVAERIVSLEAAADANAAETIDATGLVVVPGFIDPHTHATADLLDPARSSNENFLAQGVSTVFIGNDGGGIPERESGVQKMREHGIGNNAAFFAGHNDIRRTVMGMENRPPSDAELQQMRELMAEDMRAGALGLSTGLYYTPGSYAATDEVIELAKVAASYGGVYDSHLRDESSYNIGLLGAVRELIEIGRAAELPVHIAHLKALGRDVWGQSGDIIALVEQARESGLEVTADQYPYTASGTSFGSSLIPPWVMADSRDAMFARLDNPDLQTGIREEMEGNLWRRGGAESMLVTGESQWRGMTLEEIAADMGLDPVAAAVEVVRAGNPSIASFNMTVDDITAIAIQPWVMTGSDGSAGHPRKFATYPQAYHDFVVEKQVLSMEQFVHRSTGAVADFFGLCDRGYLEIGRQADIAVIDLEAFRPIADFQNPTLLAEGVDTLLVNGNVAWSGGTVGERLAGQVINLQDLACAD